jgi:hypothetical protein
LRGRAGPGIRRHPSQQAARVQLSGRKIPDPAMPTFLPDISVILAFALATIVLAITPGPDMALQIWRAVIPNLLCADVIRTKLSPTELSPYVLKSHGIKSPPVYVTLHNKNRAIDQGKTVPCFTYIYFFLNNSQYFLLNMFLYLLFF